MKFKKFFARGFLGLLVLLALFAMLQPTLYAADGLGPKVRAPANNWNSCWYTVRYGDTLFSIAVRYGVSWVTLAQINGLANPNLIYAGMTLALPCGGYPPYPPRPPYPPTPCANPTTYVVKPGDNLFRIALNFGTTVNALRDANNLWGRVLYVGTKLTIPCANGPAGTPTPPPDGVAPQPLTAPTQMPAGTPAPENSQLAPEPSASVTLQNSQVNPATVTIKVGQSVLWTNADQTPYTIVSGMPGQPNNLFTSPALPTGGTYVNAFTAAGNYSYYIMENPTMVGQINVTP